MVRVGISSWSVHRLLTSGQLQLLDLPAQLRAHRLDCLQLCHFHLPSQEPAFLQHFRQRLSDADVTLDAMLLDFGDLSDAGGALKDRAAYERWLHVAAALGAAHARISAGKQLPNEQTLLRSAEHLNYLAEVGGRLGVRVVTENWQGMMPDSATVLRLIEMTGRRIPLCLDFGNWAGPAKYAELEAIAPLAATVHAKCSFAGDRPDADDFLRCLRILSSVKFAGCIALIYDGESADEWGCIERGLELTRRVYP